MFQFHKGSIKTILEQWRAAGLIKFQFHKGSIKTISFSKQFISL